MITYGIPLRCKAVSNDWDVVSMLFNRTLNSVYSQLDPNFRILVACHEIPKLDKKYDDRIEFLQVDAPFPKDRYEMMVDKGYKIHTIAMRLKQLGGGYYMEVDADDLISNRVAGYVNAHPNENGFLSTTGFYYHLGDNYIKRGFRFPNGSSTIVKYGVDELPSEYPMIMTHNCNENDELIRKRHGDIPRICAELGRPLKKTPFPTSFYVRSTNENHSLIGKEESLIRRIEQTLSPKIYFNDEIRKEFSIYWA